MKLTWPQFCFWIGEQKSYKPMQKRTYLVNYLLLSTQFAQIELGCGKSYFLLANQLLVNNRFQYLLQFICEVLILIGCKNKYCSSEGTRNVYFNAITETITAHISDFNQLLLILGSKRTTALFLNLAVADCLVTIFPMAGIFQSIIKV